MKNLVKVKVIQGIAIAIMAVVIGFSMIACDETKEPPGGGLGEQNGQGGQGEQGGQGGQGGQGEQGNTDNFVKYEPANAVTIVSGAVVDSDPAVTGLDVSISETGIVTFNRGGFFSYKFPTNLANGTPIDIERDYDYVEVTYVISRTVPGDDPNATEAKVFISQHEYERSYLFEFPYGKNIAINPWNTATNPWLSLDISGTPATLKMQTLGSGGKGGFIILYNTNDMVGGGNSYVTACDIFDIKIETVTFTKGTKYAVTFDAFQSPTSFNIVPVIVLNGNSLEDNYPALEYPGWTFLGWYDEADKRYTAATPIYRTLTLNAKWHNAVLPNNVVINDASEIFDIIQVDPYGNSFTKSTDGSYTVHSAVGGRWWIDMNDVDLYWTGYNQLVLEIEYSDLTGNPSTNWNVVISSINGGQYGGTFYPITAGTMTFTFNISDLSQDSVECRNYSSGAYALKITKIELKKL